MSALDPTTVVPRIGVCGYGYISMNIHRKSVDMDMDMDGEFHIHGKPGDSIAILDI